MHNIANLKSKEFVPLFLTTMPIALESYLAIILDDVSYKQSIFH